MNEPSSGALISFDYADAEELWRTWAPSSVDDVLAHAAFERALRYALDLQDDGLYFRPGGWRVDVHAAAARVACVSALLAAMFHIAGLEDVDREIIIAAAGLTATMEVSPVRPGRREQGIVDRLRNKGLEGTTLTASEAHRALAKPQRRQVSELEVAEALDVLVEAGLADREDDEHWVIRPKGSEAWIRLRLARVDRR